MNRTKVFTIVIIIIALIYEAWTLMNDVPGDTISEAMWDIGKSMPAFPWLLGMVKGLLAGHFWWPLTAGARTA